jgi:hypothetical protein|tara:strand:- start:485 stop:1123 length:639 start_codon:yes stop_codon:yes gene_type:complete
MTVFYRYQDSGLDDWDVSNNYMQIGFRPGFGVQARELTQLQTILQSQITALARRFLISGSIIDAGLSFSGGGAGGWSGTLDVGQIYIEPSNSELGYFVYNSNPILFGNIETSDTENTNVYIIYEEVQVNPDGRKFDGGGGYAPVRLDESLKDNAQGYANHSAPGASRYQINIIGGGSYIQNSGISLPSNAINIAYYDAITGTWKYYDTNDPV